VENPYIQKEAKQQAV